MGGARRYDNNKLRHELISPKFKKELAKVYTIGAEKYTLKDKNGNILEDGSDNWKKGLSWRKTLGAVYRHLNKFESGEDFDTDFPKELLEKYGPTYHLANAAWGLSVLIDYYKSHPELDDRPLKSFDKKVGLDLDGVLANFNKAAKEKYNISQEPHHWYYSYEFKKSSLWDELSKDKDFWMNIEPYFNGSELKFEPTCYVTHRPIPKEWCEEWLEKNNFPCMPVHVVSDSKIDILNKVEVDIFIEDKYSNYLELNKAGIFTYLLSQPWNKKYDVGHRRINHVNDIIK